MVHDDGVGLGGGVERVESRGRCVVLVVDDDDDIRDTLSDALEIAGYQVARAADGRQALDELRRQMDGDRPPCAVLLDMMMPVMNGYQFLDEQQQDPALACVPVVVLSAFEPRESIQAAAYLTKPIALLRVLGTLKKFCQHAVE